MGRGLDNRHAVVTGGGRGIGAAIAQALHREGAAVTVMGRTRKSLEEFAATEPGTRGIICDVTNAESVNKAFAAAVADNGPVEILVNNAGAARSARFTATDDRLWTDMLDVNLTGAFRCARAVVPTMVTGGYGRIVNVASTAGLVGYAYTVAYCAAKHGVVGLTRALAVELARTSVTVNAVCPGYTESSMLEEVIDNIVDKTGRTPEEARRALQRINPQGRFVSAAEVADAVLWLCGEGAGAVNGQAVAVAGGEVMP